MVGAILLLKLIHCKRLRELNNHSSKTQLTVNKAKNTINLNMKTESYRNQDICRVCLKEGNIPIYGNSRIEDMSYELNLLTGIDIREDDEYPKNICESCYALLQGAILFKKTAQQSDIALRNPLQDASNSMHFDVDDDVVFEQLLCDKNETYHCGCCDIDFKSYQAYNNHCQSHEHSLVKSDEGIDNVSLNNMSNDEGYDMINNDYEYDKANIRKRSCKPCNINFKSLKEYNEHCLTEDHKVINDNKILHEKKKNFCKSCNLYFKTLKEYNKHCSLEHNYRKSTRKSVNYEDSFYKIVKKRKTCIQCKANFKTSKAYMKHMAKHKLLKKSTKKSALNENTNSENNVYNSETLEIIKKNHHCKRCDLDFKSYKDYEEHLLSEEHETMREKCPICQKTYSSLYIKKHMVLHTQDTTYMCDICGKKFVVQGQFSRHRLTHFYNLPFKCSLCPYRGRFTESLKMHMRTHTGEKPYQCTQCPSRFINKSNLNKHMLTHKGEHDFKCESCGKGFYTKRELDQHFKVDHTGIKDHICHTCGKAFGYRKQMMKHQLKVHKREKLRSGRMPLYMQVDTGKVIVPEE